LLYSFSVSRKKKTSRNLRNIPYLKIYLIAIVWVFACIVFPILYENTILQVQHVGLFVAFFFYLLGITIPFDIRDFQYDPKSLKTIPQLIGVEKAKQLAILLLCLSSSIVVILIFKNLLKPDLGVFMIILFLISSVLSMFCDESKNQYYYTGFLDGTMVLFILSQLF